MAIQKFKLDSQIKELKEIEEEIKEEVNVNANFYFFKVKNQNKAKF